MAGAFIFGLGFTGTRLAKALRAQGWQVRGTRRHADEDAGIYAFNAGAGIKNFAKTLDGITHIISTIPVINGSDPVLAAHGTALAEMGAWTGYISATSVYSEATGGWVTEESPTEPTSKRGILRRQAEQDWQNLTGAEIFRAAGIYGKTRSAFDALQNGTARIIVKPGHRFNRIHVDDLTRIISTAMDNPARKRILNCADGTPAESGDVIREAAKLLGVEPPPSVNFADAEMSAMARSFYATARCVDASKIKRELGLDLLYPDYKAGLKAILAEET